MPRLIEQDLPNLTFPGLNAERLSRMRRIKIGPDGQLYVPREPAGRYEIDYAEIELGLDVGIRYAGHVREGLADELRRRSEAVLAIARFSDFQRARNGLFDENDAKQRKYMDFSWIFEHAFDHTHQALRGAETIAGQLAISDLFTSQAKRGTGPLWSVYHAYVGAEMAVTRTALERVQARPYLTTAQEVMELTRIFPSIEQFGDNTDQAWKAFILEGQAQEIFSRMNFSLARTLREHADPKLCCPTKERLIAA